MTPEPMSVQVLEQLDPDDMRNLPLAVTVPHHIHLGVVRDTGLVSGLHQAAELPPGPAIEPERDRLPEWHIAILPEGGDA